MKYIEALKICNAIVEGWYNPLASQEIKLHSLILPSTTHRLYLRNLEPYYVTPELRWSNYLAEKKVAIINSFANTCEEQTYLHKAIWGDDAESLLPSSTIWVPIQTYYSPALGNGNAQWDSKIRNYEDAVNNVVNRCISENVNIAIIGCGGLCMIIGSKLKNRGLQCIVMGGATQILFGIKGKRWINHSIISKFFNDAWVYPPDTCKPFGYKDIEGGCYW